jgi:hypothetical protein
MTCLPRASWLAEFSKPMPRLLWTLVFGHHEDRTPMHGYAETREGAMAAFLAA